MTYDVECIKKKKMHLSAILFLGIGTIEVVLQTLSHKKYSK